ncbi:hypothetical protein X986_5120 [Burkholderia pseudomallei]|nr:hypothetical protein X986_5120 [Burkholderia pseudomallei]
MRGKQNALPHYSMINFLAGTKYLHDAPFMLTVL